MLNIMNNEKAKQYAFYAFLAMMILFSTTEAFAQNAQQPQFKKLISNEYFKKSIDLGLLIFAGLKWYDYFNGFQPEQAFKAIITPAVLTYLAFNWMSFLTFVGLVN